MASETKGGSGFLDALRALGDGLLGMLVDRIELVSAELQEEKLRLIQIFLWISGIVFSAVMAVSFASLALVYCFWESARLEVLTGLALAYALTCAIASMAFRRYLARQPALFEATLEELTEDRTCIRPKN